MDTAVGDAQKNGLTPIARMRLNAELMGLVRQKAAITPSVPMAALKAARVAAQIISVLGKLGVDLNAKKEEAQAFTLEGGPEPVPEPRTVTAQFYDFDPNRKHSERKKDNAAALDLLRQIDAGGAAPAWWNLGRPVASDFDALEAASGDSSAILDEDDYDMEWRIADVPVSAIIDDGVAPEPDRLEERLGEIRSAPELFRPIYELTKDGKAKIIDGWHRLQVAKQRGASMVQALVGRAPGVDAASLTPEQKQVLARYSGTGGNLVGADGKKGSAYEYYTPKPIAAGMWDMLRELGFKGGKVGDPCSGVGIFGATAPANAAMDTIELNETSGRVNQLVNAGPGYSAHIGPFEQVASRTPDEIWDAVITNVPFGGVHDRGANRKIDPKYQDQPLETYFILRSLEKLKPGGLAAFIVPPRVVSAKGGREEQLRIAASYMAEFMGAYRLPNSVFGTADADTITDVIVFRKFGREALRKIEELREQNPELLVTANVQWTEFIGGVYFQGEGKRFVLGEFQAKDPNKFRDVDRVISDQSVANIAKMLRRFPGSRIDWKALNAAETEPLVYNDGDTITMAGQTLEMRDGVWVALGKAAEDDRYDGLGQSLSTPTTAVTNKVDWAQADAYVTYLRSKSLDMDMPIWLRGAHKDVTGLDASDRQKYWAATTAGLAAIEVMRQHGEEAAFNYLQEYPAISEALQAAASTAKKMPAAFSRESKAGLQKIGIVYDRKNGFSALWKGEGAAQVAQVDRDEEAQVQALKYETQGLAVSVEKLREIYGEGFDPLTDDDWCVSADGTLATKADDYYVGNFAAFLARIDAEIAQASGAVRDKLLRQKDLAAERLVRVDPTHLRFNLFSPYVSIEEKAEFLRRFMHPAFVVAYDDEGNKTIICDIGTPKTERERQYKRFAEYLKKGNLSTRTSESEAAANPELDERRRAMLKEMTVQANAQFDQWAKANPLIMERLQTIANDPARLYFNEVEDSSPVKVAGLHPDFILHGYQNAFVRKMGRAFTGINGFNVGLGKTATALASVLYVQSIGVKKKTFFVVPNGVLSNWRKEALIGNAQPGHAQYRPPVYSADMAEGCLFVGLNVDAKTGKASVDPADYARDLNRVLENRHSKIFMTLEAFKLIPLKDETISGYEDYLRRVDPTFDGGEKKKDNERADSKLSDATTGTGAKSNAIPFFEDMGVDSLVGDELHLYKNSKNTVDFSGAKFLSVAEASQRGLDVQIKAWFVRGLSPLNDGVLGLTATPITNSPLEIYSMLCLAVGEQRVHDLCLDAKGADAFMNVMCQIEDDEEMTIDGRVKPYRVFRGLQNVELLRNAISTVMTIKNAEDVKDGGDDLKLPESPELKTKVTLTPAAEQSLNLYKLAYRGARKSLKGNEAPDEEELAALSQVSEKFGEPVELIAHPFNLINKMTLLIADPELDERATFYQFSAPQAATAQKVCDQFNGLGKIEARALAGPWTKPDALAGTKTIRDGDNEIALVKIKVMARIVDGRIVLDTMDTNLQADFEKLAEKAGLDLDCSIPPKLAALLENVRKEEANPRSVSGRVKQLIFCDVLPLHNKIKRLLVKHAGVAASAIVLVSGQSIKNAEQMQGVQDGFNAEGEENRYRYVIANEKAEVGINLQKGTQAIHHMTIGWTPDATIQRNGRGVRQGNTTGKVNVYHYDADGTFDEYKRTLTSKKADWIGAVMDKQGGNDVQIAGGLTAEEYDDLINAVGDAGAMQAIRERAELKEKQARAETARARQVINLKTASSQAKFAKQYDTAQKWIADKAMALYDLRISIDAMAQRAAGGKMNANALIKLETRLAEMRARADGMARELNESATFDLYGAKGDDVLSAFAAPTYAKSPAKRRENMESSLKRGVRLKEGSPLQGEWESEIAAAKAMADEALKDFERLAGQDGGYSKELVTAFREGKVSIVDGRLFAVGMFARSPEGELTVLMKDRKGTTVTHRQGNYKLTTSVADALSQGWTFIMFGTPEYERALVEAAQIDDAIPSLGADDRAMTFTALVPGVAQHRKVSTKVRYVPTYAVLPAPYFAYPINPEAEGVSQALRGIGERQREIIQWDKDRDGRYITADSAVDIRQDSSSWDREKKSIKALVDYASATGLKFTVNDFMVASGAYLRGSVVEALTAHAKWPVDIERQINDINAIEELDELGSRVVTEAYAFVEIAEGDLSAWMSFLIRSMFNKRRGVLQAEARRQEMLAQGVAMPPASVQAAGVAPNATGKIGIKGDTRPHKEVIKEAARQVGGKPYWNGDKVMWEVPAATWEYLVANHPRVAAVLQPVPA